MTSTSCFVCFGKTGAEFLDVEEGVSKSSVFAGEITVSIDSFAGPKVAKNTRFTNGVEWTCLRR